MYVIHRTVYTISLGMALLSAALIAFMPLLIGYSTIMRYFVGSALSVTEELSSFLLVSCVFLGLPYAALKGRHIAISALLNVLSPPMKKLITTATHVVTLGFLALLIKLTYDFFILGYQLNAHSETAYIYEPPWRAVMLVSSVWLAAVVLYQLVVELFFPQFSINES